MSLADVLGTPVNDPVGRDTTLSPTCRVPDYPDPETAPGRRTSRPGLVAFIVIAALAVGAVAGWFASGSMGSYTGAAPTTEPADLPADIAAHAELYTALHLSGALAAEGGSGAVWVNRTAAIGGVPIDDHTWQVTVAVDALELVADTYRPTDLQYFSVLVSTTGGQPSGTGVPARIPAPSSVSTAESVYTQPVPQDQAATAIGFLEQYLTDGPELNRYLAAPSSITGFEAAPYDQIVTVPLGANSLGQIRVAVSATKENGITHQLEYVLTMAIADGVWVIEGVSPAAG